MSSGQTLAQMNLTCMWLEAILYGRVETLVGIVNIKYFCRNQVIHSLLMRHGWIWIKIIVACYLVHVFVPSHSGVEPTSECSRISSRLYLDFLYRLLLFAASFQFALATAHVTLVFVIAMTAFTDTTIAATPDGANLYYATTGGNHLYTASVSIFVVNVSLSRSLDFERNNRRCSHLLKNCFWSVYAGRECARFLMHGFFFKDMETLRRLESEFQSLHSTRNSDYMIWTLLMILNRFFSSLCG